MGEKKENVLGCLGATYRAEFRKFCGSVIQYRMNKHNEYVLRFTSSFRSIENYDAVKRRRRR